MKYHEKSELDILIDSQTRIVNWMVFSVGRGTGKTALLNCERDILQMLNNLRSIKKTMDCLQKGYLKKDEALSKVMDITNSIEWVEE